MRLFFLIFTLLGPAQALAAIEWVYLKDNTAVYKTPAEDSELLLMGGSGERVAVRARSTAKGFAKVQIKRGGKWRLGYIRLSDLEVKEAVSEEGWGFGGGAEYTYLQQGGKQFDTADQVNHKIAATSSTALSPFFLVQTSREDFWRMILAYRLVAYSSKQTTDVSANVANDVKLNYTMTSGTLQRMWNLNRSFYLGGGVEVSKALSASLKISGSKIPVDQSTLPTYVGGHVAVGYQKWFGHRWSVFAEGRAGGYFNQSPMIYGAEGVLGLIYWP